MEMADVSDVRRDFHERFNQMGDKAVRRFVHEPPDSLSIHVTSLHME